MRWLTLAIMMFGLAGCAIQPADPPGICTEDYYRLPLSSLWQLQKDELVLYLDGDDEVVGVIAQIVRDPSGLMVDPKGRIQLDPLDWVKIWIYDGQRYYRYCLDDQDLGHCYQLLPKDD